MGTASPGIDDEFRIEVAMITINCACGRRFQTQDANAGKRTKCPACGSPLIVNAPKSGAFGTVPPKAPATPPPWWNPKGPAESSNASGPPVSDAGKIRTQVAAAPRADAISGARGATGSSRWPVRLFILAGVGGSIVLAIGMLLWTLNPTSTNGPKPSNQPVAGQDLAPVPARSFQAGVAESKPKASIVVSPSTVATSAPESPGVSPPTGRERSPEATEVESRLAPAGEAGRPRLKLIIPAYFYPAGPGLKQWERLIEAAARVSIVAVANPATGPGESMNVDYGSIVRRATRRGVVVLGYVNTNYAQRPLPEVQADVARWLAFYPEIRGIFLDAQPSDAKYVDYFAQARDFVRKKISGALVVTNPGTLCDEAFAVRPASDALCVFETNSGFENFRLPRWADRHPSSLFAALPHQVATQDRMRDYIQVASTRGIGLIYVTDGKIPNPWERLPSYWDAEVEAVRKVNLGEKP